MNPAIEDFIQCKRLAIVGVSRSGKKFGNTIHTELKQRGYKVSIIHPDAKEINGEPCYSSLAAAKGQVDGVVICVAPAKAKEVVREAAEAGITKAWLQMGAENAETVALAKELGVSLVSGKCILLYATPVTGFHGWHRAFARLFGQL